MGIVAAEPGAVQRQRERAAQWRRPHPARTGRVRAPPTRIRGTGSLTSP